MKTFLKIPEQEILGVANLGKIMIAVAPRFDHGLFIFE